MQEEKFKKLNFSARFLDLMESSGRTQKEIAQEIGVSEGTLINWKRGPGAPKSEELYRLSIFFGTTMEWLLTGESDNQPKSPDGWKQRALAAESKVEMLKAGMEGLLQKI
jgi:transcriptional regulator with XRE-family HTH domain